MEIYALSDRWRFDQLSQQWLWTASASTNPPSRFHSTSTSTAEIPIERRCNGFSSRSVSVRHASEAIYDSLKCDSSKCESPKCDSPNCESPKCESPKCLSSCVFTEECSSCPLTSGYASESSPQLSGGSASSRRSKADSSDSYKYTSPACTDFVSKRQITEHTGSSVELNETELVSGLPSRSTSVCSFEQKRNDPRKQCVSEEAILWSDRLRDGYSKNCLRKQSSLNPSSETISCSNDGSRVHRRRSFYDNLSPNELNSLTPDIQSELDLILNDLYYNAEDLNDNSTCRSVKQQGNIT